MLPVALIFKVIEVFLCTRYESSVLYVFMSACGKLENGMICWETIIIFLRNIIFIKVLVAMPFWRLLLLLHKLGSTLLQCSHSFPPLSFCNGPEVRVWGGEEGSGGGSAATAVGVCVCLLGRTEVSRQGCLGRGESREQQQEQSMGRPLNGQSVCSMSMRT